jgi:hypothetical protein
LQLVKFLLVVKTDNKPTKQEGNETSGGNGDRQDLELLVLFFLVLNASVLNIERRSLFRTIAREGIVVLPKGPNVSVLLNIICRCKFGKVEALSIQAF